MHATQEHTKTTLILHPKIYLDASGEHTHALLVRGGRVIAVGDDAMSQECDEQVEPQGACLFPALADAHIHVWDLGMRSGLVDLRGSASPDEVLRRLKVANASPLPVSGWVQAHGWDNHLWEENQTVTRAELDAIFPDTPVCLYRIDHHACLVNSEALRRANITTETVIEGGLIARDASGELTGLLVDEALEMISENIPVETDEELEEVFCEKASMLRSFGINCAHMAWTKRNGLNMAHRLYKEGKMPIRLFCMIDCDDPEIDDIIKEGPFDSGDAWYAARCIKYFADGAMGSRGALLLEHYLKEDANQGLTVVSSERMMREFPEVASQGFAIAVHAIGDQAARRVVDAYASVRQDNPTALLRLEHAQIMHDDDIARLGSLDIIASVQPIHMRSDSPWAHKVLNPYQIERLYNWKSLLESTLVVGGSDYPIDDPNPWHGIASFESRINATGDVWRPEQAIGRKDALFAYTQGAAKAAGWDDLLGCLHVGFMADVIALDHDPFDCSVDEVWEMKAEFVEV